MAEKSLAKPVDFSGLTATKKQNRTGSFGL
jgi:hypothetical protein